MKVDDLDLSSEIKNALDKEGFIELHPPQGEAIPIALSGKNLVAAIPTASGKSLIGFIPAIDLIITKRKKVLYIVPLKALASEKRDDLEKFSHLGFKVLMSTGDLDSDEKIADADIVIATSEKADSMIRHGNKWIEDVGLVIADEIHMIHDPGRGPTLEVILTKLMRRNKGLQIIALSATISNAEDLAEWLNAELVRSDWRPIPLKEGVYAEGKITFDDSSSRDVPIIKEEIWALIKQTIEDGGQSLVFVNSRRSTESLATKYSAGMNQISDCDLSETESELIEGGVESTPLGKKLALCVKSGIAFHNAGLTYSQRKFVEDNFKSGRIKCIVATPTLAAGINLPARRVIVRDTTRFESNSGNVSIPVMEIKQMCGRAGRPGYDPYGEAILFAKSEKHKEHLMENYVYKDAERLTSKLGNEKVMRSHILGLIATGDVKSEEDIIDFMNDTFFGSTSQMYGLENAVENVVNYLTEEKMISNNEGELSILPFGKRISDLYIDPISAVILKNAISKMDENTESFPILHAVASTPDVLGLYPKKADETILNNLMMQYDNLFLIDEPDDADEFGYDNFKSDLKVAALLEKWIDEVSEEDITLSMGIGPGDIRSRVDMIDWLLYSMNEIAFIFKPEATKKIRPLLIRVKYGIKEELLQLISFKGVGRVRARILNNYGIKDREGIIEVSYENLSKLPKIGQALARSMKDQAGCMNEKIDIPLPSSDDEYLIEKMMKELDENNRKQSKLF